MQDTGHIGDPRALRIDTDRLVLRPLTFDDYARWRRAWSTVDAARTTFDHGPKSGDDLSVETFEQRIHALHNLISVDKSYGLAMFLRDEDETLVGQVSVMDVARGVFQNAYLGWRVLNTHWRHGYAHEASAAAVRYAFEDLGLHRLEAAIEPMNAPSRALARKLGMRQEGVSRRRLMARGAWRDMCIYALTIEEWNA